MAYKPTSKPAVQVHTDKMQTLVIGHRPKLLHNSLSISPALLGAPLIRTRKGVMRPKLSATAYITSLPAMSLSGTSGYLAYVTSISFPTAGLFPTSQEPPIGPPRTASQRSKPWPEGICQNKAMRLWTRKSRELYRRSQRDRCSCDTLSVHFNLQIQTLNIHIILVSR